MRKKIVKTDINDARNYFVTYIIMRPSSLGGGRILRRILSVCPSVPFAEVVL